MNSESKHTATREEWIAWACEMEAQRDVLLAALKAQERLASLQFEGDPATEIARVRALRRAAIARAEGKAS